MKVVIFLLFFPFLAFAEFFDIENYKVKIKINEDSTIDVIEELTVNFISPRHGIFRKIPYSYQTDSFIMDSGRFSFGNKRYKIEIFDIDTDPKPFSVSKKDGYVVIKIGDKERLVSGRVYYSIRYKVFGAINRFDDHSELYWNVIGHDWGVYINELSFSVKLKEGFSLKQEDFIIFYGPSGSRERIMSGYLLSDGLMVENIPKLPPKHGVTFAIRLPNSYFSKSSILLKVKLFLINNMFVLVPLFVLFIAHSVWVRHGRDLKFVKVVEYFPPRNLTPAEVGVLNDDMLDNRDIVSLIFYWASLGVVSIEEIKGEGLFDKDDYMIHKLKDLPKEAKNHEKVFFDALFGLRDSVLISSLKDSFYDKLQKVRNALNRDIENEELYFKDSKLLSLLFLLAGFGFLFVGFFVVGFWGLNGAVYLWLSGIIMIFYGIIMPKKTIKGLDKYKKIVGFREFIKRTEVEKLKYLLSQDEGYFDKTLPYAISLNLFKDWVTKFEGLMVRPPEWFMTSGTVSYMGDFIGSVSKSFDSIKNSLSSKPKSAASGGSGFSGGGSGGGFGGGGGGSW
ncbi:MAG: DUF2207 domain-containing protein [Calditerrivibrio sp.]|nr:DUF2207 domain-containing protein [Calditerrivibrio sp.]